MTTDTKADQMDQYASSSGRVWVPLTDHERVVGEHKDQLNKFIAEAERTFEVYETALAASRAEVEGLKKDAERWNWIMEGHYGNEPARANRVIGACWSRKAMEDAIDNDIAMQAAMEKGNV